MTREERLELLKQVEKDIHVCSLESTLLDDAKSCAIHSAIEELEQEPFINKPCVSEKVCEHDKQMVLDKIRAEIESITPKAHIRRGKLSIDTELMIPLDRVFKVIDKYKGESEIDNGDDD